MATENTIIKLPTTAEEIAILLPPSQLRRLDFSALEFTSLRRAAIEYLKTYFPNDFNDYVKNNGIIMLVELVSGMASILAMREDILARDGFISTAEDEEAISNHLQLIGQSFKRATSAVVDVEVSIGTAAPTDVIIQPGSRFTLSGPDGQPLYYEIFRAPNDFTSNIQIPAGKRGVIAYGIEGKFGDPIVAISAGGPNQTIEIVAANILDAPITVDITTGSTTVAWRRITFLEQAGPNDEVFEVQFTTDGVLIKFGNDVAGKAPLAGQGIKVGYRQGGGVRGRIPANAINETRPVRPLPPASAAVEVLFRNLLPSSGGEDKETLDEARKRAPRDYATHNNAATALDYAEIASTFSHPVYGSVLKAVATVLTNINANLVDVYVLAAGPNDVPVTPSTGLKEGLRSFLRDNNVMTDDVSVKDGGVKPVPIEMVVVVSRSGDAPTVKEQVNAAIASFFNVANRDMGAGMDISPFQTLIQQIPGVKNVNLYQPADDIISTKNAFEEAANRIGYAQLLTLGPQNVKFYLEKPPGGR